MSDNYLIEKREIGNYRIRIYNDLFAECPVKNWDMGAVHLFGYAGSNYNGNLSKYSNYEEFFDSENHSVTDAVRSLVVQNVSVKNLVKYYKELNDPSTRIRYDRSVNLWKVEMLFDHKWYSKFDLTPQEIKDGIGADDLVADLEFDDLVSILNKYAKNIATYEWTSTGYCQGDYIYGFSFMTKEKYDRHFGKMAIRWKTMAESCMKNEVKEIGMWAWGDVKNFILERRVPFKKVYGDKWREDENSFEWEEVDSCSGYFMETEELISEVIAEHQLTEESGVTPMPLLKDLRVVDGDEHQGVPNILWSYECGGIDLFFIGENNEVDYVFNHDSIDDFVGMTGNFAVKAEDYETAVAYNKAFDDYWSMGDDSPYESFEDYISDYPVNKTA